MSTAAGSNLSVSVLALGLAVALLVFLIGMAIGWFLGGRSSQGQVDIAVEKARSETGAELATFRERVRSLESDRQNFLLEEQAAKTQADALRTALDTARDEKTQLTERASRLEASELALAEAERRMQQLSDQLATAQSKAAALEAELRGEIEAATLIKQELTAQREGREAARAESSELRTQVTELTTRIEGERRQSQEKLALLLDAKEALSNQFKSLANDILEEKSKRFAEQNQASLGQMLDPLKMRLQEFQGKVEQFYDVEGKERSALGQQVLQLMELNKTMADEAKNLTSALKGSAKTQGNWGELILERVLEASGLRKGSEYEVQESLSREDGSKGQPDVVIRLPEGRHMVVDAKVSLIAYEEFSSATDDTTRLGARKRHLDSIRVHMKGLSERNYQSLYGLKSLDFVLMFVPIEPAFMLGVTEDNSLFMDAWNKNVLLVSPSTLLFVVRTVAHLWRQEAQSKNAQEIAKRGGELYDRLTAFVADLERVGKNLKQAQDAYGDAFDKLSKNKGNVIRQAEMLKDLGIKPSKSLPQPLLESSEGDDTSQP